MQQKLLEEMQNVKVGLRYVHALATDSLRLLF